MDFFLFVIHLLGRAIESTVMMYCRCHSDNLEVYGVVMVPTIEINPLNRQSIECTVWQIVGVPSVSQSIFNILHALSFLLSKRWFILSLYHRRCWLQWRCLKDFDFKEKDRLRKMSRKERVRLYNTDS